MEVLLFHRTGAEQCSRQYTSPGRWVWDQDTVRLDRAVSEGEVIELHVGHGVMRNYIVTASDGKLAFAQAL